MTVRERTALSRDIIINCVCGTVWDPKLSSLPGLTHAAVLVGLVERSGEYNVLLTKRTEHLRDHAGQISFPGGRIETSDASPEAAALREAEEEVGLQSSYVDIVGRLPAYRLRTGYLVKPVVGFVDACASLQPDPYEVAEIFEVPLSFFLNPANHELHQLVYEGEPFSFYAMPYRDYYIWGATAAILRELYETLRKV
ncbi:CoA pyrophosphatase [Alkalilimnicola ehrlichii]|uniref:CoA pyrophosphatase n=1 Tax=Alkalilimnicola ehrlichii TaxID=351052 RepID=A0A3E0WSF2_9GAMM|nr:CoA pyrophosphatase [Alkalilimnicola ehrlichii]RFA28296.1 CoA pyrophosphatase [Alkalilimnicola ehrlichii]RFA34897.1 CoA pyrophosphatase [Alkalilimnicola ehrlichii]